MSARPAASFTTRASHFLLTPRGQLALAAMLFGLAELLALPFLIFALVVMPYRGGPPAIQAEPAIFWSCLAVALGIPAVSSLFLLARLRRITRGGPPADQP